MKKLAKAGIILAVSVFFSQANAAWAQQEEFFLNPERNTAGVTVSHRANFSRYDVSWGVVNAQNEIVISFRNMGAPQNVQERFIASHEQLSFVGAQAGGYNEFAISWNGRRADGHVVPYGLYFIVINHVLRANRQIITERRIPVTIITREISFEIELDSHLINRNERQRLFLTVSPPEMAYSWRVRIRKAGVGEDIVNRLVSSGQDAFFPGFFWNDYAALDSYVPLTVIVEATDRAGIRVSRNASFHIIDAPIVPRVPIDNEIAGLRRELEIKALEIANLRREIADLMMEVANRDVDFSYRLIRLVIRENEVANLMRALEMGGH